MTGKFEQLSAILADLSDLDQALNVLTWDRETNMPQGGGEDRANQMATLSKLQHAMFTSDEVGRLLEDLWAERDTLDPDGERSRIIAVTKRDYDLARKLPQKLIEDLSRASSAGLSAWLEAKWAKDYSVFAPFLRRNAELNREVAGALGYKERPYDALLDRFEPGMTTAQLEAIFSELKAEIVPLVREIGEAKPVDDSFLFKDYDAETQLRTGLAVAERFGYDLRRGRLDLSPHPFTISLGTGDVRITTRVQNDFLSSSLFAILHESGHGMYEQAVSPALARTPLGQGASPGVHESQSRLWENLVGRSRPFQEFLFPHLQKDFPGQLGGVDIEAFYRAINKVYPSLIRVEADEVTYNLHIMLRFELENEMLEDRVDIDKLDEVWADRMGRYLGVVPSDDAEGVLQDIHWSSAGAFGTFPGYTLGNIIGAQLFEQAHKALPGLDGQISRGEFEGLLGWLQSNVYHYGRMFAPNELMERVTGSPVGTGAWVNYVRGKFGDIYGL